MNVEEVDAGETSRQRRNVLIGCILVAILVVTPCLFAWPHFMKSATTPSRSEVRGAIERFLSGSGADLIKVRKIQPVLVNGQWVKAKTRVESVDIGEIQFPDSAKPIRGQDARPGAASRDYWIATARCEVTYQFEPSVPDRTAVPGTIQDDFQVYKNQSGEWQACFASSWKYCLREDVHVVLASGLTCRIGDLRPGDRIRSIDPANGQDLVVTVQRVSIRPRHEWIDYGDGIVTTPEHPMLTPGGWISSGEVTEETRLYGERGWVKAGPLTRRHEPANAVDITVSDPHTFVVSGRNGVRLVHNKAGIY